MSTRYYKSYGGVVQLSPKEAACQKEVLSSPRFAKVEWPLSLLAKAYATSRTTGMRGNATDKDWTDRRRLIAECMARKTTTPTGGLGYDTLGIDITSIPLPWLIAGALAVIVVVLMVTRR